VVKEGRLRPRDYVFDRARAMMAMAEALACWAHEDPPVVGLALRPLLEVLPPCVSRKEVSTLLGIPVSAKTLRNLDSLGKGPRIRFKDECSGVVLYPAPFLLEWIERRGLVLLVSKTM
jgi:hypothetical protein